MNLEILFKALYYDLYVQLKFRKLSIFLGVSSQNKTSYVLCLMSYVLCLMSLNSLTKYGKGIKWTNTLAN